MLSIVELKVWGWCILFFMGVISLVVVVYLCCFMIEMVFKIGMKSKEVGFICGLFKYKWVVLLVFVFMGGGFLYFYMFIIYM